ncbi:PrsW family glutamic-type intramembrane protease [Streptococcus suis]|uniref:PrsW family glutamic-type intramembrane protease n=3 Tax=Streptococcus suis TaxID=1307 RepID=UPI000CF5A244|nr:PrsW family glutamic-type intramembrane protease [Streptococcus suis]MCB2921949.1 PrsW family intramembrane metalloprotease [Streptococcus suis]MCB2931794.1 PrsW family intramembrane metalloprotease [Streptococcus suis]MCB2942451.1 PrsW family intramembrane metalloprotease [Streptococcus suis]MCB2945581.1 PrsW family intramembrane metalloprotease [Streptococcus suis]MCB2955592.1 PrsW family intramembrane metalloprotease [Streptococcus suis]
MKQFCAKHKMKLLIFLAVWSFFSGCKVLLTFFGKPDGMDGKYPLFFLTISLVALYVFPMILIIRYIAKRFDISKKVIHLSWILGITASFYFSGLGQTLLGAFWLFIVKPPQTFIQNWGAAVTAPFHEEFGKGLVVLLVLLLLKKLTLKNAVVSGMIVGLSFQIIEDGLYVFQQIFKSKADGFATLIERMLHAGGTHWAFSLAFAVGLVALVSKNSGMSKKQGFFWMLMAVLAHFFLNTPFNEGLTSNSGEITVLMLCFSFCVALAAFFKVDQIETTQHYQ